MSLSIELRTRARERFRPQGVDLLAETFRWHCIGGPKTASLKGRGAEEQLWHAIEWLGFELILRDETQQPQWWGQITKVEIRIGPFVFGVELNSMANRVQVAYETQVPGSSSTGERGTTPWLQDAGSVSAYGLKEALLSLSNASEEAALSYQKAALNLGRLPVPTIALATGYEAALTIEATGWWWTLDWRYALAAPFGSSVEAGGTSTIRMLPDVTTGPPMLGYAQRFIALGGIPFALSEVAVRIGKAGNPAPGVVGLVADNGGTLGAILDSVPLDPALVPTSTGWTTFPFASRILLTPGQPYWLTLGVYGTSGFDAANHYTVDTANTSVSLSGTFARFQGAWGAIDGELYYRVGGMGETTQLLASIVSSYGQFFTGIKTVASGVHSPGYADGDARALQVAEELLAQGSTRAVRLLATVNVDRQVLVFDEPASTDVRYLIGRDGTIRTVNGLALPPGASPVGAWAKLLDVLPSGINFSLVQDPTLLFIEEAEYTVSTGRWLPTPRGVPTIWDLG